MIKNDLYTELKRRGLIAQCTNEQKVSQLLSSDGAVFYIGFDPTADSLHVGHLLQLVIMSHMQKAGHTPIAILGGGTAMVGDPSGRSDMRTMLTPERIDHNIACFKKQMSGLVDFNDGKALMINNGDWLLDLNYIEFLRDVGVHFSVNRMLTAECFKTRLEKGLSFIEFNYMLMQSYDFLHLFRKYGCTLQLGGDDQWSNIIGGIELIRRVEANEAYGLTFTLLTTSEGKKMGKTQSGAVWLDPDKTSPFEFYQYWRNVQDADVIKCMKMLTFLPVDEIEEYEKLSGNELNPVKERLAYEITAIVHGKTEADNARGAAQALFSGGADSENIPMSELSQNDLTDGAIGLLDLLVKTGLAPSKAEARRLVMQGGVEIGGIKVSDASITVKASDYTDGTVMIKKGKKTYHKIIFS